jgi:hypothetical protein
MPPSKTALGGVGLGSERRVVGPSAYRLRGRGIGVELVAPMDEQSAVVALKCLGELAEEVARQSSSGLTLHIGHA